MSTAIIAAAAAAEARSQSDSVKKKKGKSKTNGSKSTQGTKPNKIKSTTEIKSRDSKGKDEVVLSGFLKGDKRKESRKHVQEAADEGCCLTGARLSNSCLGTNLSNWDRTVLE